MTKIYNFLTATWWLLPLGIRITSPVPFMAIYKVGDMCQLPTYSQANEPQMMLKYRVTVSAVMLPMFQ